jgi:DNA-binding CsgD family transcriptional regulator
MKPSKALSPRENEVVQWIMQGVGNKRIASGLGISESTVEFHIRNIFSKLAVNTRVELILKLGKTTGAFGGQPGESTVENPFAGGHNGMHHAGERNEEGKSPRGKETAMTGKITIILAAFLSVVGTILILAGVLDHKGGAVVIGLSALAAGFGQWFFFGLRAKEKNGERDKSVRP